MVSNVCYENELYLKDDVLLPVFQLHSRIFKDMIELKISCKLSTEVEVCKCYVFFTQVRQLLQERMPTVYGSPPRAMVHENEEENPPEPNPSSKTTKKSYPPLISLKTYQL